MYFLSVKYRLLYLSLLLFLFFNNVQCQDLIINEFVASNVLGLEDEDGGYEDWIELLNTGTDPIDLDNFSISDDLGQPNKWTFPSIVIQPGEYLIIFASGKDRIQPNLHTNFSISSSGEELLLSNPNGIIISFIPPIELPTNISYGCYPNGQPDYNYFFDPTPEAPNQNNGFEQALDLPTVSHSSGFYEDSFYLKAYHNDPNAIIRYTLDGSIPNENSAIFPDSLLVEDISAEPDNISSVPTTSAVAPSWYRWYPPLQTTFKGTNIRLRAFTPNGISFKSLTKMFFVHPDMEERYQMPFASLTTPQNSLLGSQGIYTNFNARGIEWEREAHFKYFEPNGNVAFDSDIGIRVHGGNSRRYAIKSFRLYFRNRYGESQFEYSLLLDKDVNIHERLILRNSGSDWSRTYIRDAFVQDILTDFSTVEQQGFQPAITFVNGEYWGVMNFRGRYDNNYLRIKYNINQLDMLEATNSVAYGSNFHYNQLLNYMSNNDLDQTQHYEEVKNRMDVENFRDYHILQVFSMNTDQPGKNVRFWKSTELDNKWRWLWFDLDDSFIYGTHCHYTRNGLEFCTGIDSISSTNVNPPSSSPAWAPNGPAQTFPLRSLLSSTEFRHDFINRFGDLLNTAFQPDYLFSKIDSIENTFNGLMEEHYLRWHRPEPSFRDEHLGYLYEFSANRQYYMRQHIVDFFELTGKYDLTLEIGSGDGYIHLNTISIDTITPTIGDPIYPWTGVYFNDVPINLEAIPRPGYVFSHWEGYVNSNQDEIQVSADEDITLIAHFAPDSLANSNFQEEIDFTIYPNPATKLVHVKIEDDQFINGNWYLFNLSGQLIENSVINEKQFSLDINNLRRGAYIMKLVTKEGVTIHKKLIKK
jgi:hypothetical protein